MVLRSSINSVAEEYMMYTRLVVYVWTDIRIVFNQQLRESPCRILKSYLDMVRIDIYMCMYHKVHALNHDLIEQIQTDKKIKVEWEKKP